MANTDVIRRNAEMASEYLAWQRHRRNRSRETLFIYTDVLHKFLQWIDTTPLAAVPVTTMEDFIDRPRLRRRPEHVRGQRIIGSPATRKRDVTILRSFYRYLTERGLIGANPALLLTTPTVRNVVPKAIPDDIWRAVWSHPRLTDDERVALGLGFFCGLRRAEVVSLRPDQLDVEGGRIVGFVRKGGSEDSFPLGSAVTLCEQRMPHLIGGTAATLLDPLAKLVSERTSMPYLLPWGDHLGSDTDPHLKGQPRKDSYPTGWAPPNTFNKRLRRLLRRCGLPENTFTVHALRHSAITNWLRMGVPLHVASRLASHGDIATTMRYVSTGTDPLASLLGDGLLQRPGRWQ